MSRLLATLAACLATASAQYSYGSSAPPAPASQMMDSYPMSYESGSSMMGGMLISTYGGGSSSWTMVNQPMDSTSTPMTHNVTVGGSAGLVYTPDSIMANVGDYVIFTFMSENHTATQSNFATPCVKMDGAFDSGFMPNPNNTVNPPPAMKFQVMVSTPLWFYCRQKTPEVHCGKGMTFSINPTSTKTQSMFQAMAIQQNGTSTSSSMMSGVSTIVAPPPGAPPAAATGSSSIIMGSGYMNGDTCTCQCLCGSDSFPSAGQGMNMMGGMGGSIPNVMAMPAPPAPAGQSIPPPPPPPPMSSSYMMAAPPPPPPMMSAPAAASGSYGSSW